MPRNTTPSSTTPRNLKPFVFYGVELRYQEGESQAIADCPFCGKENKFHANPQNGSWDCKVCGEHGNPLEFLRRLYAISFSSTKDWKELAEERGLLDPGTLQQWGLARSVITSEWLFPGWLADGRLVQLYRYARTPQRKALLAAPHEALKGGEGFVGGHQLFGCNLYHAGKSLVYLCEGPWDAIALWETLRLGKRDRHANVLAVPSCSTFLDEWVEMFEGKTVSLLYDSDHPRERTAGGGFFSPGADGMKRALRKLEAATKPPKSVQILLWGPQGYDPALADGYDVRDWLRQGTTVKQRLYRAEQLFAKISLPPEDWKAVRREGERPAQGALDMDPLECTDWKTLVNSWKKALKWTEGLDRALSVMLACVTSTKAVGDQLWCKIMGPASCGKSTLCEALAVAKQYVVSKSTIRGFHSGFQSDRDGKEDNSLLIRLKDKTLITKDGDTLLQSPNLGQILSEARDIYDTTSRTHYRNRMSRDYQGIRMTWILCGTSSLRILDSSELGERFLDCVIMDGIDDTLEDEVLLRLANRNRRNLGMEANGSMDTQFPPEIVQAMRLTGGYVEYLRNNATKLLGNIHMSDEAIHQCIRYGKLVAFMRARPSTKQQEVAEREFAARLVTQIQRLAACLAVVLNRSELDAEVMRRVRRVALDTARGLILTLTKELAKVGSQGRDLQALEILTGESSERLSLFLRFLRRIGAVESYVCPGTRRQRWKLTEKVRGLYLRVLREEQQEGF